MADTPILAEGLIRGEELLEELNNDVISAYDILESNRTSQYLRRCVIRSIFSYIEAVVEIVKIEVRSNLRTGFCEFELSDKEEKLLGSLSIIRSGDSRISLNDNVKGTFRLAAKIWKLDKYHLDTDGVDFDVFRRATFVRDKLTHPKTFYDIQITDEDMSACTAAGFWIRKSFENLFEMRSSQLIDAVESNYGEKIE